MSPNEKRLLTYFGTAIFIMANYFGYMKATAVLDKQEKDQKKEKALLEAAQEAMTRRQEVDAEMEWLAENEPEPKASQDVEIALQEFAQKEAISRGLTIKRQTIQSADTEAGKIYHRAKVEFLVSGTEEALYRWIDSLQSPKEFRAVTSLDLRPNKEDIHKIDAKLMIEQWFVPLKPAA